MRRLSATPPAKRAAPDATALTPNGVQILRAGVLSEPYVVVRVLGVYRCKCLAHSSSLGFNMAFTGLRFSISLSVCEADMADPALRRVLPGPIASHVERDVFDLLVTDGHLKVTSHGSAHTENPPHSHLRSLISSSVCSRPPRTRSCGATASLPTPSSASPPSTFVHDGALDAETAPRAFCVLRDLVVITPRDQQQRSRRRVSLGATAPTSSNNSAASAAKPDDDMRLVFHPHSGLHARDHCALPLAGDRLYYLSLLSDDCPLDWEPSSVSGLSHFTVSARYVEPWAEWNSRRRYCPDVFRGDKRVLYSTEDVTKWASNARGETSGPPTLTGVVRYKSKLTHLGDPTVDNAFPFMFHIVLCR
ncbi:hypothetical protein PINS_up010001 [Pythium insidiosum]|nr:hypothetical protein PINS_up010001 [Pythium insidiosum]